METFGAFNLLKSLGLFQDGDNLEQNGALCAKSETERKSDANERGNRSVSGDVSQEASSAKEEFTRATNAYLDYMQRHDERARRTRK